MVLTEVSNVDQAVRQVQASGPCGAAVRHDGVRLSCGDVRQIRSCVLTRPDARLVCIHLERIRDTTLGALAGLVQLRRQLLKSGRDLRLVGLRGRAEGLHALYRLADTLPRVSGSLRTRVGWDALRQKPARTRDRDRSGFAVQARRRRKRLTVEG